MIKVIENFEALFYTVGFIVPGFILIYTRAKFTPIKQENTNTFILKYMMFSAIMYILCSPIIWYILNEDYHIDHPLRTMFISVLLILLVPILIGIIIGIIQQKEVDKFLLNKIGVNTIHNTPTAWDYKFSSIKDEEWIIITTNENKRFMGKFGACSFASSDPNERELLLEKLYVRDSEDKDWIEHEGNSGVLIKYSEIKYMEFIDYLENKYDEVKNEK